MAGQEVTLSMSLACTSRSLQRAGGGVGGGGGGLSWSCRDQVLAGQDTLCPVGCGSVAARTAGDNRIY